MSTGCPYIMNVVLYFIIRCDSDSFWANIIVKNIYRAGTRPLIVYCFLGFNVIQSFPLFSIINFERIGGGRYNLSGLIIIRPYKCK